MVKKSNVEDSSINEFELLEFKVGNNCYGINVAKIKEILSYKQPTPVPNAHEYIEGIFMPRNAIITSIDLAKALKTRPIERNGKDMSVITKFNDLTVSFHVQEVVGIHRVLWKDINRPDQTIDEKSLATGIIRINDRLIIVIDLEKIMSEISIELGLRVSGMDKIKSTEVHNEKILMVEDSTLLSKEIKDCLNIAGYKNVVQAKNGKVAWDILQEYKKQGKYSEFDCVITDIEMPIMDGKYLTKLIRDDEKYSKMPVVIFSTIVDNADSNEIVIGADAELGKPDIVKLISTINDMFAKNK
jgi:two-component system chemotaxis response regulator CheV